MPEIPQRPELSPPVQGILKVVQALGAHGLIPQENVNHILCNPRKLYPVVNAVGEHAINGIFPEIVGKQEADFLTAKQLESLRMQGIVAGIKNHPLNIKTRRFVHSLLQYDTDPAWLTQLEVNQLQAKAFVETLISDYVGFLHPKDLADYATKLARIRLTLEGLSDRDIATALGMPGNSGEMAIRSARFRFSKRLCEGYPQGIATVREHFFNCLRKNQREMWLADERSTHTP